MERRMAVIRGNVVQVMHYSYPIQEILITLIPRTLCRPSQKVWGGPGLHLRACQSRGSQMGDTWGGSRQYLFRDDWSLFSRTENGTDWWPNWWTRPPTWSSPLWRSSKLKVELILSNFLSDKFWKRSSSGLHGSILGVRHRHCCGQENWNYISNCLSW